MAKKQYGWIYDKSGNKKTVSAPVTVNDIQSVPFGNSRVRVREYFAAPKPRTKTGALLGGVGFGGVIGSNIR